MQLFFYVYNVKIYIQKRKRSMWVRVIWERQIGKELEKRVGGKKRMQCVWEIWWACFMFGLSVAQSLPQSLAAHHLFIRIFVSFSNSFNFPSLSLSISLSLFFYSSHIFNTFLHLFFPNILPFLTTVPLVHKHIS